MSKNEEEVEIGDKKQDTKEEVKSMENINELLRDSYYDAFEHGFKTRDILRLFRPNFRDYSPVLLRMP